MTEQVKDRLTRLAGSIAPPQPDVEAFARSGRRRRARRSILSAVVAAILVLAVAAPLWALSGLRGSTPASPVGEERIVASGYTVTGASGWMAGVFSMLPDGSDVERLTPTDASYSPVAISPDGSRIAFVRLVRGTDEGGREEGIYVANSDGSDMREVLRTRDPVSLSVTYLQWSPDGSQIGFIEQDVPGLATGQESSPSDKRVRLMVMGADGSDPHVLVDRQITSFSWSPDGGSIAYALETYGGIEAFSSDIYVMNADGSDPRRLTEDRASFNPLWSPDGARIAFHESAGPGDVAVMNPDGSGVETLANDGEHINGPLAWSPDSTRVLAMSYTPQTCSLLVLDQERVTVLARMPLGSDGSEVDTVGASQIPCVQSASWGTVVTPDPSG
jgi:Tol biopolymer transport system component